MSDNTPKVEEKTEESQLAEFQSEAFDAGEPIETEAAPVAKPKDEAKVEEKPAAKTDVEGDAEKPAGPKDESAAGKEGEQPKKTAQERINEITRSRREAERLAEAETRRANAAEQRARELEAQINAPAKKEEPAKKDDKAEADPNEPKPDNYEFGELDSKYVRDLARYEADKRFAELRQQDEQTRQQTAREEKQNKAREKFEVMVDRGSKVHEDFYEKVVIGSEKGEWPLSETMGELLLESEVGNDIAYHLAMNPQEADQVYRSSPTEQARYFGRMEAKFSAGQAAASGESGKPAPRTPKAPAPVETARGAGGQFQASADTDDFSAFEARANSKG